MVWDSGTLPRKPYREHKIFLYPIFIHPYYQISKVYGGLSSIKELNP